MNPFRLDVGTFLKRAEVKAEAEDATARLDLAFSLAAAEGRTVLRPGTLLARCRHRRRGLWYFDPRPDTGWMARCRPCYHRPGPPRLLPPLPLVQFVLTDVPGEGEDYATCLCCRPPPRPRPLPGVFDPFPSPRRPPMPQPPTPAPAKPAVGVVVPTPAPAPAPAPSGPAPATARDVTDLSDLILALDQKIEGLGSGVDRLGTEVGRLTGAMSRLTEVLEKRPLADKPEPPAPAHRRTPAWIVQTTAFGQTEEARALAREGKLTADVVFDRIALPAADRVQGRRRIVGKIMRNLGYNSHRLNDEPIRFVLDGPGTAGGR